MGKTEDNKSVKRIASMICFFLMCRLVKVECVDLAHGSWDAVYIPV